MSTLLKPGECMSHGYILNVKNEEIKAINKQIDAFFKDGGKIEQIETGKTGMKEGAKFKFSI